MRWTGPTEVIPAQQERRQVYRRIELLRRNRLGRYPHQIGTAVQILVDIRPPQLNELHARLARDLGQRLSRTPDPVDGQGTQIGGQENRYKRYRQ